MARMQVGPEFRKCTPRPRTIPQATLAVMLLWAVPLHGQDESCPELAQASFQTIPESADAFRSVVDCMVQQLMAPVLDNLAHDGAIPPDIAALSQQIVIQSLAAPPAHTGPNAVSKLRGGRRAIILDFYLMREIVSVSDLASLLIAPLRPEEIQPLLLEVKLDWARSFSATQRDWLAASNFSIGKFVTNDSMKVIAKWLSPYVSAGAMAFVALHEVAHHHLGHVNRDPASAAESREWEFQADSVAGDLLLQLRYGLAPVKAFLEVQAIKDQVEAKVSPSHSDPGHPPAAERLARLVRARPLLPPGESYASVGVLDRGMDGRPTMLELNYPNADLAEEIPFVVDGTKMFGIEWRQGTAFLFQRQGDLLATIEVANGDSLYPTITIRRRVIGGVDVTRSLGRGFRRDFALVLGKTIGGMRAGDAIQRRPLQVMREALARAGIPPETATEAVQAGAAKLQATRAILLKFYRGEIDTPEMLRLGARADLEGQERLENALGPEAYRRFRTEMLNDALVKGVLGEAP